MDLFFLLFNLDAVMQCGFPLVTLALLYWQNTGSSEKQSVIIAITANNILLLLLNLIVLLTYSMSYFYSWYSQVTYEQYAYNFSPDNKYQLALFLSAAISYHFLPFIMLSKAIRRKLSNSLLILSIWIFLFILQIIFFQFSISALLYSLFNLSIFAKIIIYIILFNVLYFLVKRRKISSKTYN